MQRWVRLGFLVLTLLWLSPNASAQNVFRGIVTRVHQGDELVVRLDGWDVTVRLHGIACPVDPPLDEIARRWTATRLKHRTVVVTVRGTAARGVIYGDVERVGEPIPLAVSLLENGLARWEQRYAPRRDELAAAERRAQTRSAGLWGDPQQEALRLQAALSAPTPRPRNAPQRNAVRTAPPTLLLPVGLGLALSVGLLILAEAVSRQARRLRTRPQALSDAPPGLVKVRGLAQPHKGTCTSVVGRISALYLREVTQQYQNGRWRTLYDETDAVPFQIDDGTGMAAVPRGAIHWRPIRVARFYNDIPVEHWHTRSYSGDLRTEIFFIPPDVRLTLLGRRIDDDSFEPSGLLVIEGDEQRLAQLPTRLALACLCGAIGCLIGTLRVALGG